MKRALAACCVAAVISTELSQALEIVGALLTLPSRVLRRRVRAFTLLLVGSALAIVSSLVVVGGLPSIGRSWLVAAGLTLELSFWVLLLARGRDHVEHAH